MSAASMNQTPRVLVQDYKGFALRECTKGYLAFKDGRNLQTCKTVEEAKQSVDEHLKWEVKRAEWQHQEQELAEAQRREEAERQHVKTEAVLACIKPIRNFVAVRGMGMLRDCVEQLDQEARDRNVPNNWELLVRQCEAIGEQRCECHIFDEDPSDVEVDKYGVTEYYGYNSNLDSYADTRDYGLQEYVDSFREDYEGDLPGEEPDESESLYATLFELNGRHPEIVLDALRLSEQVRSGKLTGYHAEAAYDELLTRWDRSR